ncbi:ATP synthase subunit e, mitochondrial [Zancudomyces culisetae]|uniref:ATP synthase F(0) complex subunit e, mitochondrial n=1 Tax=Zancudomyces culisetae TaxID=1213189 RepID=A0A1R1PPZ2_ZANCU|nr:ATP synthase subunit e, mitochondrial [Zancudomyces culisetae]OMH82973.1 ATP synthase subunit e, mitochondrial [Zancudomyces culisetae]|eukprot:OMH80487.1 ATP synthase subunit e, mitochondrial [Zancudomyces culisetae]
MSATQNAIRKVSPFYLLTRYGALGFGIAYGFVHARTLRKEAEHKRDLESYNKKVQLVELAKQEYSKKNVVQSNSTTSQGSVNFEDPNFNAEEWAKTLA